MAQAQRLMRQPTLAEAGCRAALAQDPHDAEALCLLGELHADRGQFDAAQALFKRAIETDPACVPAYFSAAVHCKMGRDQHAWRNGVQRLLDTPLSLDREMTLRFALGKYHDDVGEYEQAFDEYRRANDLAKRHGFAYEADKLERHIDAILGCLPAAADLEPDDGASASTLPVLVIGLPRSGTSLIEQILASHPQVYGAGEVRFWNGAFNQYEQTDDATRSGAGRQMVREYLARLTEQSGTAVRVIDKMPANFLYAGLFHRLFPNAKVIHIHRHPIDNCLSIYFQRFYAVAAYANDLDDLVHYHRQYTRIMDHWRRLLPSSSLLEVSYEDLVGDQEAWTRRMLDFVGLPWDPKCLDFHETNRVVLTSSKWQVRQKMHSGSAGRWRHYDKFMGPLRALLPVAGD
jgi:tetratricopeptide (TPR) repeat protein